MDLVGFSTFSELDSGPERRPEHQSAPKSGRGRPRETLRRQSGAGETAGGSGGGVEPAEERSVPDPRLHLGAEPGERTFGSGESETHPG